MVSDEITSPSLAQAATFLDDGHIDQALTVYHALIATGGEEKMTALFGVASCYARRKQWEEAEEVLNQIIQQIPTFRKPSPIVVRCALIWVTWMNPLPTSIMRWRSTQPRQSCISNKRRSIFGWVCYRSRTAQCVAQHG